MADATDAGRGQPGEPPCGSLPDSTIIGAWDWNLDSGDLAWSAGLHAVCGTDPATFRATPDAAIRLTHPDDVARLNQALNRTIRFGVPYDLTYRLLRSDGGVRRVHAHGDALRRADGHT